MELVTKGRLVGRPLVSRLVRTEPVALGFVPVRDGRISTVPDGLTLIETLWVEMLLTLAAAVGVELRVKLGRRAMAGGSPAGSLDSEDVEGSGLEQPLRRKVAVVVEVVVIVVFVVEVSVLLDVLLLVDLPAR